MVVSVSLSCYRWVVAGFWTWRTRFDLGSVSVGFVVVAKGATGQVLIHFVCLPPSGPFHRRSRLIHSFITDLKHSWSMKRNFFLVWCDAVRLGTSVFVVEKISSQKWRRARSHETLPPPPLPSFGVSKLWRYEYSLTAYSSTEVAQLCGASYTKRSSARIT